MSFGTRPSRSSSSKGGPPTLFVFLVGIAIVFGVYYLWLGVQNYLRTGGLGVSEATERAQILATATAERVRPTSEATLRPSSTPVPPCEEFVVSVPNAIVRESPSPNAAIVTSLFENSPVCVVGRPNPDSEWFTIDINPGTRRLEAAYMHESVIRSLRPTPTASRTITPLPTITPAPLPTSTPSPISVPTSTDDPDATDTPIPPTATLTPTATPLRQSA